MKKNRNAERRRRENRGAEGAEHRGARGAEDRGAVGAENRGAEGAEGGGMWGGGVPLTTGEGSGGGGCEPPRIFFDLRPRNSVFGAFWALYFTIQLPALRTESGYIKSTCRG